MKSYVTKNGFTVYQLVSGRSNVFLVSNGAVCYLVDTSVTHALQTIDKALNHLCLDGLILKGLILTHAHFDHCANAVRIKEKYKIPVIAHKDELDGLRRGNTPLPKGTLLLTKALVGVGNRFSHFASYSPVDADTIVEDHIELKDFGTGSRLIHTPGHTNGSLSVVIDNEIAIVGDAMFGIVSGSVFPPFAEDPIAMVCSWKRLLDTGCRLFLPSHGTADSRELLEKQYLKYSKKFDIS